MNITDYFTDEKVSGIEIITTQGGIDPVTGLPTQGSDTTIMTLSGILYQSSARDTFISDKVRAESSNVLILDPDDITTTIIDSFKVKYNNNTYSIVKADNVAFQGEAVVIALNLND
jgi:hypothetical protein